MQYTYRLRTDTVRDEEGNSYTVYGIEAINPAGEVAEAIPDLFFNRLKAEDFVDSCSKNKLSIIDVWDAAEKAMELATQDIIAELVNVKKIAVTDAMNIFYGSEFCQKLYDESTGLYLEGTKYLYGLLENEIENGKLIQNEI